MPLNTPAHALVNAALLTGGDRRDLALPAIVGGVLPDLPAALFYLWHRFAVGLADEVIWGDLYHRALWEAVFAPFHSLPIWGAIFGLALWRRARVVAVLSASVVLHALADLPLHGVDAHRHFFPLWDYRFISPLSYWDRAGHAQWVAAAELGVVLVAGFALWRRYPAPAPRGAIAVTVLGLAASYGLGLTFWGT